MAKIGNKLQRDIEKNLTHEGIGKKAKAAQQAVGAVVDTLANTVSSIKGSQQKIDEIQHRVQLTQQEIERRKEQIQQTQTRTDIVLKENEIAIKKQKEKEQFLADANDYEARKLKLNQDLANGTDKQIYTGQRNLDQQELVKVETQLADPSISLDQNTRLTTKRKLLAEQITSNTNKLRKLAEKQDTRNKAYYFEQSLSVDNTLAASQENVNKLAKTLKALGNSEDTKTITGPGLRTALTQLDTLWKTGSSEDRRGVIQLAKGPLAAVDKSASATVLSWKEPSEAQRVTSIKEHIESTEQDDGRTRNDQRLINLRKEANAIKDKTKREKLLSDIDRIERENHFLHTTGDYRQQVVEDAKKKLDKARESGDNKAFKKEEQFLKFVDLQNKYFATDKNPLDRIETRGNGISDYMRQKAATERGFIFSDSEENELSELMRISNDPITVVKNFIGTRTGLNPNQYLDRAMAQMSTVDKTLKADVLVSQNPNLSLLLKPVTLNKDEAEGFKNNFLKSSDDDGDSPYGQLFTEFKSDPALIALATANGTTVDVLLKSFGRRTFKNETRDRTDSDALYTKAEGSLNTLIKSLSVVDVNGAPTLSFSKNQTQSLERMSTIFSKGAESLPLNFAVKQVSKYGEQNLSFFTKLESGELTFGAGRGAGLMTLQSKGDGDVGQSPLTLFTKSGATVPIYLTYTDMAKIKSMKDLLKHIDKVYNQ